MQATEPSSTAKTAAITRGEHRRRHAPPWVLDDQLAFSLAGPGWKEIYDAIVPLFPDQVSDGIIAWQVTRARYAEERLTEDFAQYVILGAGLDSFAWRRPDTLGGGLTVYEVDHPATQAWKQERAEQLALPRSERHVFAPVDFETQTLREGLDAVGFDWAALTLFSWLGVIPYLTPEAIRATLETITGAAPGSEVVVHYALDDAHRDDLGQAYLQTFGAIAAQAGEPLTTFWSPDEAEAFVSACGLKVVDHPDRDGLIARYFAGRGDGLAPIQAEAVLTAAVP
jgi:methyltransferase (TIGR00027 family)